MSSISSSVARLVNRRAALTQREMDIAASIQKVTEEIVLRLARTVHEETGEENRLSRRRRRAQLCRQRPASPRGPIQEYLDSACSGRCKVVRWTAAAIAWYEYEGGERRVNGNGQDIPMRGSIPGATIRRY